MDTFALITANSIVGTALFVGVAVFLRQMDRRR
jgi:hypothetical protein